MNSSFKPLTMNRRTLTLGFSLTVAFSLSNAMAAGTTDAKVSGLAGAAAGDLASLRADLQRISTQRIYFGHQSVGDNLLAGIQQLATQAGVPLKIAKTVSAEGVAAGTLGHTYVAVNNFPLQKLEAFDKAMGTKPTGLDAAMLKFCYLDITPTTDVRALFASYRSTVEQLRLRSPGLRIIHMTAPLTIVQTGPKAWLKRAIGKAPFGAQENIRREEYNDLLRQTYSGHEPVFDLAKLESTQPDGSRLTASWNSQVIPALVPEYSDDGQHLNLVGQQRAARELISILASSTARSSKQ